MVSNFDDHLFVVVNAACKAQDIAHMQKYLPSDVEIEVLEDRALLALQGPKAGEVRAEMAKALGLTVPEASWHTDRTSVLRLMDWMVRVNLALGKLGEDCIALVQTGIGEISLGGA